jgi:hypothetical protein
MDTRRISQISARIEFLRAAEFVARTRNDDRCWVAPQDSLSPAQLREHDGNYGSLVEGLDRAPSRGDQLMTQRQISEETARLTSELREAVGR